MDLFYFTGRKTQSRQAATRPEDTSHMNAYAPVGQQEASSLPQNTHTSTNERNGNDVGRHINANPASTVALPLSMALMRAAAGMCCQECSQDNQQNRDTQHQRQSLDDRPLGNYDLQALQRHGSSVSPLVLAPLLSNGTHNQHHDRVQDIIHDYIAACKFYGCGERVNPGVLTSLRFSLPAMRVAGSFHDADMLALTEILFKYGNGQLSYIKRLDFSLGSKEGKLHGKAGFRSHGAFALSKAIQSLHHVEELLLQRNRIGSYGASAIFIACASNDSIRRLELRRCGIGERGALAFAEILAESSETALADVDLSANMIGFRGCMAVEEALRRRSAKSDLSPMVVDLEGNLVLQEVMNGVTHGLGILLAALGCHLLMRRVEGYPMRHVVSCAVYSTSLLVLYTSSTLYHSFFTLQHTKYIFEVLDKCAIYILIAGSYTPFLRIVLFHEPVWSIGLLIFIWSCCLFGILVEAFLPDWQYKGRFSLMMYLGMGWTALVCLPEIATLLPDSCIHLMVLGGVGYTAGVPFFVRDNNLDHAMWHLFVLSGSIFHYLGVYLYVAQYQYEAVSTKDMESSAYAYFSRWSS